MKTLIILCCSIFLFSPNNSVENPNEDLANETEVSCYWEETFLKNISVSRGTACGKNSSLKIYYTNPYPYKVRVGFYLANKNGNYNKRGPHAASVSPGKRIYHHICESNGNYVVVASKYGSECNFPIL